MAFAVLREMKASLWDNANIRANNRGDENTPGGGGGSGGGGGGSGGGDFTLHDKISDSLTRAQAEITRLRSEKVSEQHRKYAKKRKKQNGPIFAVRLSWDRLICSISVDDAIVPTHANKFTSWSSR